MEDVRRAIADGVPDLLEDWRWDARNVLLTLARMWLTAATGKMLPKDRAADWAIARLPPDAAAWLARARADYLGLAAEDWAEAAAALRPTVERLAAETEASLGDLARPRRPVQRLA
jgi:streptomycin 3"-adenylyltransferase